MSEFLILVHPKISLSNLCTDVMIERRGVEYQQWGECLFTPLIFTTIYKKLVKLLSAKHGLTYGVVMEYKSSFSLL